MNVRTVLALSLLSISSVSHAALVPDTLTLTFSRTNAVEYVSTTPYIDGSTIVLTNCTALISVLANTNVVQDLTDCGLLLYVGNGSTSTTYTAVIQVATSGTFCATIILPTIVASATTGYASSSDTYASFALAITSGVTRIDYRDEKRVYLRQRLH